MDPLPTVLSILFIILIAWAITFYLVRRFYPIKRYHNQDCSHTRIILVSDATALVKKVQFQVHLYVNQKSKVAQFYSLEKELRAHISFLQCKRRANTKTWQPVDSMVWLDQKMILKDEELEIYLKLEKIYKELSCVRLNGA